MNTKITLNNGVECFYSADGLIFKEERAKTFFADGSERDNVIELKISHILLDDYGLFDYNNELDDVHICSGDGVITYYNEAENGISVDSLDGYGNILIPKSSFFLFQGWLDVMLDSEYYIE